MSGAAPTVSVCIPTYKGAATLGAAIESVLAQTLADFELIVVDDASPDETATIVAAFRDARIRYVRNETNLGPEGNWNRCLELARGRYFKLLPHDDLLSATCLDKQVAVLEEDAAEKLALAFSARRVIGPNGRLLARRGFPGCSGGALSSKRVIAACVRRGTNLLGEPGGVLFRRDLALRVGAFDATDPYVVDLDYWFRLLRHGDAYYLAEELASFRVWPQSWSVAIGDGQSSQFRRFLRRVAPALSGNTSFLDRAVGTLTPTLNNLARLAFYALYIRRPLN